MDDSLLPVWVSEAVTKADILSKLIAKARVIYTSLLQLFVCR